MVDLHQKTALAHSGFVFMDRCSLAFVDVSHPIHPILLSAGVGKQIWGSTFLHRANSNSGVHICKWGWVGVHMIHIFKKVNRRKVKYMRDPYNESSMLLLGGLWENADESGALKYIYSVFWKFCYRIFITDWNVKMWFLPNKRILACNITMQG